MRFESLLFLTLASRNLSRDLQRQPMVELLVYAPICIASGCYHLLFMFVLIMVCRRCAAKPTILQAICAKMHYSQPAIRRAYSSHASKSDAKKIPRPIRVYARGILIALR